MNDKITAVTANLNSILVRLDWIREQNYNDPDAVDLMGDVAEWVCEIGEAIEAIEKSLTPALSKGGSKPGAFLVRRRAFAFRLVGVTTTRTEIGGRNPSLGGAGWPALCCSAWASCSVSSPMLSTHASILAVGW